jgi:hypothetical protein
MENTVKSLSACMLRALPSNGRCLQRHCLATGLYATVLFNHRETVYWLLIFSISYLKTSSVSRTFANNIDGKMANK